MYNGLNLSLGNLSRLSDAKTRSISPENLTGEKNKGGMATEGQGAGCARDLGQGWKISPWLPVQPGETLTLAEIDGPGAIQHIWLTATHHWRHQIIRVYYDHEDEPSIEVPCADFFGQGWCQYAPLVSLPVCVNPGSGFNCYWEMPFRKHIRITYENLGAEMMGLYFQIDYALTEVPSDAAYLHAQFRRVNPLPYKEVYTLIDGVRGKGHYVGAYMAWGVNNNGWWGEGEIKFYLDGDEWPTICGTGTEDYFCGSYGFNVNERYQEFNTPYAGMHQVIRPDALNSANLRFGLYRWHIMDPIRFEKDLRVTIQALGWRSGGRYLPLQDDIASVVWWYQAEPHAPFPQLPGPDDLEVI